MPSIPPSTSTRPSPSPSVPVITPRAQPYPESSQVVLDLTTLLTIADFSTFYPGVPPTSFHPAYDALADGSLVAPPLRDDLAVNNAFLIITGCLLSIFLRNVCKAAIFLCRRVVKKKGLLYTLLLSQLLGLAAIVPVIVAQFSRFADCTVVLRIFFVASSASLSLLVTGIFGVKAYRCLDNNRLVWAILVALRSIGSVVLILDVVHIHTFRSLAGRCHRPSGGLVFIFIILLLAESLFICACFLYAVRKSHGPVTVRGRVSVRLSLDDVSHSQPTEARKESVDSVRNRRGWSDVRTYTNHLSTSWRTLSREPSIPSTPHDSFHGTRSYNTSDNTETAQSSKHPIPFPSTVHSHPPPSRSWMMRIPTATDDTYMPETTATSSAHSPISRFTRYIPRMSLFREVMRDELCYTAITSVFTAVCVVMVLVGIKGSGGIGSTLWVAFDWALISLLAVHSFGRVIRRHENESLLLHPSARYHDLHTDRTTAELLGDVPQPVRTPGMLSRARARRSIARRDLESSAPPSELPMRRLFSGSAQSSQGDLHSLAASTSGTSNIFPSMETESFSRTQVSSTVCMDDGPSRSPKSPEEWFNKNLAGAPPPPEPPDEGRSCTTSADVS